MGSEMAPKTSTKKKRSRPTSTRRRTHLSHADVEGEEEKEEELAADRAADQIDGQRRGVPHQSLEDHFHEQHYQRQLKL
jgi:hypothetical protein